GELERHVAERVMPAPGAALSRATPSARGMRSYVCHEPRARIETESGPSARCSMARALRGRLVAPGVVDHVQPGAVVLSASHLGGGGPKCRRAAVGHRP